MLGKDIKCAKERIFNIQCEEQLNKDETFIYYSVFLQKCLCIIVQQNCSKRAKNTIIHI